MTAPAKPKPRHTLADWLAEPEALRKELVNGDLVQKALPDYEHGAAQFGLSDLLRPEFHRRGGGGHPGGWWIVGEVDIQLGDDGFRPDLSGWRRERVPQAPTGRPIKARNRLMRSRFASACCSARIAMTKPVTVRAWAKRMSALRET